MATCFPGLCKANLDLPRNDAFREHPVSAKPRPDLALEKAACPTRVALHRAGCLAPGLAHKVSAAVRPGDGGAPGGLPLSGPEAYSLLRPGWQVASGPDTALSAAGGPSWPPSGIFPPKGSDTDSCAISETGVLWPRCQEASGATWLGSSRAASGHTQSAAWSAAPRRSRCRASCTQPQRAEQNPGCEKHRVHGHPTGQGSRRLPAWALLQLSLFSCHSSAVTLRLSLIGNHSLAGEGTVVSPRGLKVGSPGGHS